MGEEDRAQEREKYLNDLRNRLTPEEIKEKCDYYENVSLKKTDWNFVDTEAQLVYMYLREPEPWEISMQNHYAKQFQSLINILEIKPNV